MANATCPKCKQSKPIRADRTFDQHTDSFGRQCAGSFQKVDGDTQKSTQLNQFRSYGFPGRGGIDR